jgi:hypothetical protein
MGEREGKYADGISARTSILSVPIVIVLTAIVVTITIPVVVVIIVPSVIGIVRSLPSSSSSSSSAATAIRHRYFGTGLQAERRSVRTRVYGILTPIKGEGEGEGDREGE